MIVHKQISNTPSKHVYPASWSVVTCGGNEPDVTNPGCSFDRTLIKWHSNTPSKHVYPDSWPDVTCGGNEPDVTSPGCVGEHVLHDCVGIGIPIEFLKDN